MGNISVYTKIYNTPYIYIKIYIIRDLGNVKDRSLFLIFTDFIVT